jgi:hypothetical protein
MKRTLLFAAFAACTGMTMSLRAQTADDVITIASAADLVQLATDVNSGKAESANVVLAGDIDMSSVSEWTPIGDGSFSWASNKLTITGNAFKGTFDGKGYAIRNLQLTGSVNGTFGLFGVLDGATVKNFTIGAESGDQSSFTITATGTTDAGIVAGLANEATIENITNYASLNYNGTSSSRSTMAMVGFIFCNENPTTVNKLNNYGEITLASGGNTTNGATCVQGAGIVGFSTNDASSKVSNVISNCTNYGNMTSATARTSGIIAAANKYTSLESCVNYGNQINTFEKSGNGRLGNITCITGTACTMKDCINYGNLISTTNARVGGLVSLVSSADDVYTNCANYGIIISDNSYRGLCYGYLNVAATISGFTAGGNLGTYNNGSYVYDEYSGDDLIKYLGTKSSNAATPTDITYKIGTTTAIETVPAAEAADVVSTVYYNLQGVRVAQPENGIFIKQQTLSNGQQVVTKTVVR